MRVAVIDEAARAEIAALCWYADLHRLSLPEQLRMSRGERPPVGDDLDFCLTISGVYRCVFSIEEYPGGWCRRLSISIREPNPARQLPSHEAVEVIAGAFGFRGNLKKMLDGAMWLEGHRAVNVVERLEIATRGKPG